MKRVKQALHQNLIWLVVCAVAVILSTLFSDNRINAVTANVMYTVGAWFGAWTLWKSATIGHPDYGQVKTFVFTVALGLFVLGLESLLRGVVVFYDTGDWYVRYLSAPLNIAKLFVLAALLVVNDGIRNKNDQKRLATNIAIGIGAASGIYLLLFFVVRAIVA